MGTVIVSLILVTLVAVVIRSLVKAKRSGKSCSCGGSCSSCSGSCAASSGSCAACRTGANKPRERE